MRFRILGPLEVLSPNGWTAISAAKWRSLLACLLVQPGQLVSTDALIDELWGDSPPNTANNLVSIYVHRLRKLIGDSEGRVLVYRAHGYQLRLAPGDLDLGEFDTQVTAGSGALAAGEPERAAGLLGAALSLWRGPLLADVAPTPLLALQVDRAAELRLSATELRIEAELACGRPGRVVPELRGLVGEHPIRERLWLLLMRALEDAGRRAEALEAYAQARQSIADELGVDPGTELRRLHSELLAADGAPAAGRRPGRPRPRVTGPRGAAAAGRNDLAAPPPAGGRAGVPTAGAEQPTPVDDAGGAPEAGSAAEVPGTIAIGTFAQLGAPAGPPDGPPPPLPVVARPAQLPADIGDFTGRETHVSHLCALLLGGGAASSPGAVRIAVVNGAGGLGKTTLAVHAAHEVSAQFPDGQLYVDLLGASAQTASPGEVLARFLRDLGVDGDKVPARDDERGALYRTTLTGRRVLILLDNAKDAAQVRPLLPGSSSCAVLVTTRNRTPDLASTRFVDLNVLEDDEALAMFSRIVGEERAAAEPDATAEILVACAGLPLAIRICAARLAARRQWRIATLAGRLRNQQKRLDELKTGDLAVRASFQVSYDSLTASHGADPARAFRLLGLWQGESISLPAAAALLGVPEDDAADALEILVDVNLLESPGPDRYRFHDLLRVYAIERAEDEEPDATRGEAVARLLRWYLESASAASDTVSPLRYQVPDEPAAGGYPPIAFATADDVFAWYDDERANIVAATRQSAAAGLHAIAWRLPPTLFPVFSRRSSWADCVISHRVAVGSAVSAGDRAGEAWARNQLGFALTKLRDPEAVGHLERALAIRKEIGDTRGEAQTAISLAEAHVSQSGPSPQTLSYLRLAVDLLRPGGPSSLRATAVNNLGDAYFSFGDLRAAEDCYIEARDISREIGGHVEGHALQNLGSLYQRLHRLDEAIACLEEAVLKHRAAGLLYGQAVTLKHLGSAYAEAGDSGRARRCASAALELFEQIGEQAEVSETAALLASFNRGQGSPIAPK
jgi:DNA-binding SARP family transcriptional activator